MDKGRVTGRDLGVPFRGEPGCFNAITDVAGVRVGHSTIIKGEDVRTGVTAVLPRPGFDPVFAGWFSLNGNGEMTGTTWVEESGFLEGPVLITNTHSVGVVHDAVIEWMIKEKLRNAEVGDVSWSLPVVGETWDGRLNDINGFHVGREHVFEALDGAVGGVVEMGNVGGGTGMVCHQFKGGIGSASRVVDGYVVGVLVQANYGLREQLMVAGVPVGLEICDLMPEISGVSGGGGSIIVVVATDAPLLPYQLKRLARRVPMGIARVGGVAGNGSGDIFIAFSTANSGAWRRGGESEFVMLSNDCMTPFFEACVWGVEEAIVNALVAAESMIGFNGNTVYGLPHDRLRDVLRKYNRLEE
jgi:D-aminopeptidase